MNTTEALTNRVIETCPRFCAALTHEEVATFVGFTTVVEAEPQEIIAELGDVSDIFFLVLDGELTLLREDAGKEIEVGRLGAGNLVDIMSFFEGTPRSTRLRATKRGVIMMMITRPMYQRLCIEYPYIAVNLLEFVVISLSKLTHRTSQDVSTLHKQVTGIAYC